MTLRIVALAALLCVAAGCASTDRRVVLREMEQASVRATQPLAKVLVVTIDGDAARRRTWDEAFASRLGASGVQATTRGALLGDAEMDAGAVTVDGSALIDAARRAGADAVLFVQPPSDVPVKAGRGAQRWMDARSDPDPRTDLDTTPSSVTEVRLYAIDTTKEAWRALVVVNYPSGTAADASDVAASVVNGMAKRGFIRASPR